MKMMESPVHLVGTAPPKSAVSIDAPIQDDLGLTLSPRSRTEVTTPVEAGSGSTLPALCDDHSDLGECLDSLFYESHVGNDEDVSAALLSEKITDAQWLTEEELQRAVADVQLSGSLFKNDTSFPELPGSSNVNGMEGNLLLSGNPQVFFPKDATARAGALLNSTELPQRPPSANESQMLESSEAIPPLSEEVDNYDDRTALGAECRKSIDTNPAETDKAYSTQVPRKSTHQPPKFFIPIDAKLETLSVTSQPGRQFNLKCSRSWTRHFPSARLSTSRHSNLPNFDSVATSIHCQEFSQCDSLQLHTFKPTQPISIVSISKYLRHKMSVSPFNPNGSDTFANVGPESFALTPLTPTFPDAGPSGHATDFNLDNAYGSNVFDLFSGSEWDYCDFKELADSTMDCTPTGKSDATLADQPNQPDIHVNDTAPALPPDAIEGPTSCEIQSPANNQDFVPLDQFLDMKQRILDLQTELIEAKAQIQTLQLAVNSPSPVSNALETGSTTTEPLNDSCRTSPSSTIARLTETQKRMNKRLSNDNWRRRKAEKASLQAQYGADSAEFKAAVSKLQTRTGRISKAGRRGGKGISRGSDEVLEGVVSALDAEHVGFAGAAELLGPLYSQY